FDDPRRACQSSDPEREPPAPHRPWFGIDSSAGELADQAVHRNAAHDAGNVQRRRAQRVGWKNDAPSGRHLRHGRQRRSNDGRLAGGIAGLVQKKEEKEEAKKVISPSSSGRENKAI